MSITPSSLPNWDLFGNDTAFPAIPGSPGTSGTSAASSRKNDAFAGEVNGAMAAADAQLTRAAGRQSDTTRPDTVAQVREAMSRQNQVLSPTAEFSLAKAAAATQPSPLSPASPPPPPPADPSVTPVDHLQNRALSTLTSLAGGNFNRLEGSSAALNRGILLNGGTLKRARGIELGDRTGGIPLDPTLRRALEQAAVNRARKAQGVDGLGAAVGSRRRTRKEEACAATEVGKLAARFESGSAGIAAIGYDRVGGTSYGKYQIASRPGSMDLFLNFLDANDPAMAERLRSAGPANTGNTKGAMPDVWRTLAAEDPARFEALQEQFIHESHYQPALAGVSRAGYNTRDFSPAMQEVLFSTAVQHGPAGATRIFEQAADNIGLSPGNQRGQEREVIREIYSLRADRFGSSTPQIQAAARRRMEEEGRLALAMS